jgi:protein-disulfide isomerase
VNDEQNSIMPNDNAPQNNQLDSTSTPVDNAVTDTTGVETVAPSVAQILRENTQENSSYENSPVASSLNMPATTPNNSRTMLNYVVIAVTFLAVGLVMGLVASNALLSADQVKAIVEEALADMPTQSGGTTVVNMDGNMDASFLADLVAQAIEQNDAKKLEDQRNELVDDDPYIGDENAPITIVEFSAYACPYCARHFVSTFQPLLDNYGQYIRYVYRDLPIINPDVSLSASLAAECADEQNNFWDFHNTLFQNQDKLGREFYISTAQSEGLDITQFTTCFDDQKYMDEVTDDYYAGEGLNITGTPTFWINGEIISGALPYDRFERVILKKLKEAGIDIEQSS